MLQTELLHQQRFWLVRLHGVLLYTHLLL